MRPGDVVADELLEEQPGGQCSPVLATDVLDVGDRGVDQLAVLGGQGQVPDLLTGTFGSGLQCFDQFVVGSHESGDLVAERHHAGSGERGEVDDGAVAVVGGDRERVAEHESTLGVGIEDLNGRAVVGPVDVAGPRRVGSGHIVGERRVAGDRNADSEGR